ncbi:MAG TPA: O-antigen polymerase [Bacteroidota bacterium]|nr:O-antigen polymerase [Bacteroidota bacterium]
MNIVPIFCFLACFSIVLSALRKGADILSPFRVFGFVWAAVIGLTEMKLSGFQHEWSAYSWAVLLSAVVSVLVGILFVDTVLLNRARYVPLSSLRSGPGRIPDGIQRKYVGVLGILAGLYLVSYAAEVVVLGNVPVFSPYPDRARMAFGIFGVHLIVTLAPAILILATEYFLVFRKTLRHKTEVLAIFIITFLSYSLLLQRFSFVMWVVVSSCLAYYYSRYVNWKSLLVASGGFTAFIMFLQSIRLSRYVENYIYVVSRMRISRAFAALSEPYMYTVMNLENFARGVDRLDTFTMGLFTFDPLLALVGLKHPAQDYFGVIERPFLNSGYNTFPFMWTYYRDFGYGGMVLICLVLGIAIAYYYNRFRTDPTLYRAAIYALGVFFMTLSFFTNVLTMLNMATNIGLIYLVNRALFPGGKTGPGGVPVNVFPEVRDGRS